MISLRDGMLTRKIYEISCELFIMGDIMDSRTLVKNLLTKKPTERMGFCDKYWYEVVPKWRGQGFLQKTNEETGEVVPVSFEDWFDTDVHECWDPFDVAPLRGYSEVLEVNDKWKIKKDGYGAAYKLWRGKTGVPEHMSFEMERREVWEEKYKPHLIEFDPTRHDFDRVNNCLETAHAKNKSLNYATSFIWELLRHSLGDITLYMSLLDDPDWILDFNRTYTDFFKTYYKYVFEKGHIPDHVWFYEDWAYNKGPFCSPDIIREYFVPFYQEMTDFFHSYDIPVVLHSCGNIETILPIVVESGFDGLNPMEVKAGCDVVRFAEKYGDKLSFFGGLDVRILENGDKSEIKKEVLRICDTMRRLKVGYLFGTDHSITPNVDYESYRYAVEVFRENCYM